MTPCLLCHNHNTELYYKHKNRTFGYCSECGSVFVEHSQLPVNDKEKQRYEYHNDDIVNSGYKNFVDPLITSICNTIPVQAKGLDFGSGPVAAITTILNEKNYNMASYDPFFKNDPTVFELNYDFVVACEVIEHLHHPITEFTRIYNCLRKGGRLFCMTDLLPARNKFKDWYYKNDFTHVIFYSDKNLNWLKNYVGFSELKRDGRIITLIK